jgi:hypothetical protein
MMSFESLMTAASELASRHAVNVAPVQFEAEVPSPLEVLEHLDAVCQALLLSKGIVRFNRATEYIRSTADEAWSALRKELDGVIAI